MIEELPPPTTVRWVIARKALVVAAVRDGRLSLDEACSRYSMTHEEFLEWVAAVERWLDRPLISRAQLNAAMKSSVPA